MRTATCHLSILTCLAALCGLGQQVNPPGIEWQRSFGGDNSDMLTALQQTSDAGYILGGWTTSGISGTKTNTPFGGYDWWVIRLDANGNEIWQRAYGGTEDDYLYCLQQTPDGGFILAGSSSSPPSGNKTSPNYGSGDAWVVRIDPDGNVLWQRSIGGTGGDAVESLQRTSDGGFILGGWSGSPPDDHKTSPLYGSLDFWCVRLDSEGNKLWESSYGGTNFDTGRSIQQTTDGGFVLGGETYSGADGNKTSTNFSPPGYFGRLGGSTDYWIVRVDTNGVKLWEREFGSEDTDRFWSLDQTSDGGFIIGGYSFATTGGNKTVAGYGPSYDYWIVRLDSDGNKLCEQVFGGTSDDKLGTIHQTRDGGFLLAGISSSSPSGNKTSLSFGAGDLWLLRLNATGNKLWEQPFGGTGNDGGQGGVRPAFVWETADGGFVVGGDSNSGPGGNKTTPQYGVQDWWILKLGGCCSPRFVTNFPGRGSIAVTPPPGTGDRYEFATELMLAAISEPGYSFSFWSGAVQSTDNPLTVTLFGNDTIAANFATPGTPAMFYAPSNLTATAQECRSTPFTQDFKIWNSGGGTVRYRISPSVPWLAVSPEAGGSVGQTNAHTVTYASSALAPGIYTGLLNIESTKEAELLTTVEVVLQVDAQRPTIRIPSNQAQVTRRTGFRYFFLGESNCLYVSEFSTDFSGWIPLQTNLAGATEVQVLDTGATNAPQRFYRSRVLH